jgi:hypothetical protein
VQQETKINLLLYDLVKSEQLFLKLEKWPQQNIFKKDNILTTYIHYDSNQRV